MFTVAERAALRAALVEAARPTRGSTGAALTGSAAVHREDRWPDIDLALSVAGPEAEVVADWTGRRYAEAGAVDDVDLVPRGHALSRPPAPQHAASGRWLLAGGAVRPIAATFRLLFGTARELVSVPASTAAERIGMGWLYALHARSSIARGRAWQAEYMLSALRDEALALACRRYGLPAGPARGILLLEGEAVEPRLAARLAGPLPELTTPPPGDHENVRGDVPGNAVSRHGQSS